MARQSTAGFERVIRLAIASVKPPEVQREHARHARQGLAEHLAQRPGPPPRVRTIVDGRVGASEDSVKPYGVIRYEFDALHEAVLFGLKTLQDLSPVLSGTYQGSWFVLHRGAQVDPAALPADADDVIITNDQPYSRMLLVGRRADGRPFSLKNPPPGYLERAYRAVMQRFGNSVNAGTPFIELDGGYRLQHDYVEPTRWSARRDRRAGAAITYPSLQIWRR